MGAEASLQEQQPKIRVFLSYSRKDRAFAERLRDRLIGDSFDAYLDVHDIVKGEPWRERLQSLIFGADAVLFLVSPDSVASEICDWEVSEAERLAKRVLPVVCRATPHDVVPGRLKRLNYSFLDGEEKWSGEYPKLREALGRDIHWLREHTRLSDLAARWERDGRPEAQLLRLDVVRGAREWEARRPADATLSDVLIAFLESSEEKEAKDRERLLTITGRAFVNPAEQALADGRYDAALRLAAAGTLMSEDFDMRLVPELLRSAMPAAGLQRLLYTLRGRTSLVESAAFSPDGAHIVTAGDRSARVWDAASACEIAVLWHGDRVSSAAFSPDNARIITASHDNTARIWDVATRQEIAVLRGHGRVVQNAGFSPNGARVFTVSYDGVRVWDTATGRLVAALRGHGIEGVRSAAFSPDSARIVIGLQDRTARLWDVASDREIVTLRGHEKEVQSAVFSSDGAHIATASFDSTARIWNSVTGSEIAVLRGHENKLQSVSFSPDGLRIATASNDDTARVWDAATGAEIAMLRGHEKWVYSAVFSPDGTRVVTASDDETARLWDAATGREIAVLRGHENRVSCAAFSSDGTRVITASWDHSARVWDAAAGREIGVLPGHQNDLQTSERSPDGARIIRIDWHDRTIAVVGDSTTSRVIAVLRGHEKRLKRAAFSLDGTRAITTSEDNTTRIWDVARTVALVGDPVEILAASLTNGRGVKTDRERSDLLMQAAPDDLYEALMARLTPAQRENVARRSEILSRPLDPNCYPP